MGKQLFFFVAVAIATTLPEAMAADSSATPGARGLMPQGPWAVALSDRQMAELRGGYREFAFGLTLRSSAADHQVAEDLGGVEVTDNNVEFTTIVAGAEVPDFTGILQLVNVEGNLNVVNNQLFVQVLIVNSDQLATADLGRILGSVMPPLP